MLRALLAGDEEKAIKIYVLVTNGKSLEEDMYPSLPFLENNHETPMHLVHDTPHFSYIIVMMSLQSRVALMSYIAWQCVVVIWWLLGVVYSM